VCLSVCMSIGWSVAIVSPARTAEPVEMPFVWDVDSDGPKEPRIVWGLQLPVRRGNFEAENIICTANGWLKQQDQQFFHNEIQKSELWRNAGQSAFQLQETVLKSDKIICISQKM